MVEISLTDNEREYPNEYTEVERPMLVQLAEMGWQYVRGDLDYPQKTFRERFRDVVLRDKLRQAIRRINRDENGNEFLDDVTIDRAIREFLTTTEYSLFDRNRELTEKRIRGVFVEPAEGTADAGQRSQWVKLIEFDPEHLDRNEVLAINQFRVDFVGRTGFVIPDIVLFVNGIPLAVIECKSPSITEPMQAGIDQLLRYSNNRPEVEEPEGVEHLFLFNQLMVSTWFYDARVGTFASLVQLTTDLVAHIQTQIRTIDFWRDDVSRLNLETWVYNTIRRQRVDGNRVFASDGLRELATQIVDLAWNRRRWLVQ